MWTRSKLPTKGKEQDSTTSAWERILSVGKSNDANWNLQGVEVEQAKPGTAPENSDDSIATALQNVMPNHVKSPIENTLATIPDTVEKAVEQLFHVVNLSAQ